MSEQLQLALGAPAPPPDDTAPAPDHPVDQPARDRVAQDLDSTLFVEAGAGSGKTSALVDRILALIRSGIALENIAAITFTEKAAAELRQRVRDRIEKDLAQGADERLATALRQLDAAALSTLHAFAQRILFEHPIESGLPPGVEVLDELASQVDFDDRWDRFLPELLNDPAMETSLLVADVLGIGPPQLRTLAQQFEDNWDLVAERLVTDLAPLSVDIDAVVDHLRAVAAGAAEALDGSDQLAVALTQVADYADELEAAAADPTVEPVDRLVDVAELLCRETPHFGPQTGGAYARKGAKTNWPDEVRFAELKERLYEAGQHRDDCRGALATAVIHQLAAAIGAFVLRCARDRRREGRLRFHDLLVLARETLRDPEVGAKVRADLGDRYQRLLIDEFQDTDPIQVDLAVLLAAEQDPPSRHWSTISCTAGRLFFVGDPKQSIYRFRRADMATYLQAQAVFGGTDGHVRLSTNFRSSKPVIEWVNRVFAWLIQPAEGSQPVYAPLDGHRPAPRTGPGVLVLGARNHDGRRPAPELRRLEAADVVGAIVTAVSEGWTVVAADGAERAATLGDITVLLPARTSLGALEEALENAGIPYRAETASLVYATPEVRDLLMIARAADDPTDELAVVAALRTPAFACGDDDLYRYRQRTGATWNHQAIPDDAEDDPVVAGLRFLGALHLERTWLAPAQVLDRIVSERRLLQLGVCRHRHREVWRRLRFVVDQARAWTDATGGDLREYLTWVRLQASESSRVAETVLPETDSDAVRIMTIHASKGLEFPIAVVSGLTTQHQAQRVGVDVVWPPDGSIGYRLGANTTTPEYDSFVPLDEQMDRHERVRLLYVACTRARDHLVVSMHRCEGANESSLAWALAGADAQRDLRELTPTDARLAVGAPDRALVELPDMATWQTERNDAVASAQRSRTVAATTLASWAAAQRDDPGLQKAGRDLDLPPWQKGRYGTAVGRAVHGVLQTIDLATGAGLRPLAAAQAAAEGILGREATVEALVRSALASATVSEAAVRPHWREIFVAAPVGDRLLEGYIDLLYRSDDGLVVVDHKTDAWDDDEQLEAKVARYRIQTAAYALAVESATGSPVVEAVLLFLTERGATARTIRDLPGAKAEVAALTPTVITGGEASNADA